MEAGALWQSKNGTFESPVLFAGAAYAAGVLTEGTYRFNSWRLTYHYRFKRGARWNWWIGGTVKIRDSEVGLRQGDVTSDGTDVGLNSRF